MLESFSAAKLRVLGIRDTPAPSTSIPDCLAVHPENYRACDGPRQKWEPGDPLPDAIRDVADPHQHFVDLNDYLCGPRTCSAVMGGVPVYFDGSHMTATFATTLAPYLDPYLQRAIRG